MRFEGGRTVGRGDIHAHPRTRRKPDPRCEGIRAADQRVLSIRSAGGRLPGVPRGPRGFPRGGAPAPAGTPRIPGRFHGGRRGRWDQSDGRNPVFPCCRHDPRHRRRHRRLHGFEPRERDEGPADLRLCPGVGRDQGLGADDAGAGRPRLGPGGGHESRQRRRRRPRWRTPRGGRSDDPSWHGAKVPRDRESDGPGPDRASAETRRDTLPVDGIHVVELVRATTAQKPRFPPLGGGGIRADFRWDRANNARRRRLHANNAPRTAMAPIAETIPLRGIGPYGPCGLRRSVFTVKSADFEPTFPALSEQLATTVWGPSSRPVNRYWDPEPRATEAPPSRAIEHPARPEVASVACVTWIDSEEDVIGAPGAFGRTSEKDGGVRSILICVTELARFPAASIATISIRKLPSVSMTTGPVYGTATPVPMRIVCNATPLVPSVAVDLTVTLLLYQPAFARVPTGFTLIVGGVPSIGTKSVVGAPKLRALSIARYTRMLAPSPAIDKGPEYRAN